MLVLITGCAGFIGSRLAQRLLNEGIELLGIDNFDPYYDVRIKELNLAKLLNQESFKFIKGDINNKMDLESAFSKKPDLIVHLAAKVGVLPSFKDPVGYIRNNLDGTINLLEYSKDAGVKKLIFASSSSVYGNTSTLPYKEDDQNSRPISLYGLTKIHCEDYCRTYSNVYGLEINALRFFTVYGPGQRPDMAINKFILSMMSQKTINVYGKGDTYRDYTYIDDIISGILGSMNYFKGFNIFNLGSGNPITLDKMIKTISSLLDTKPILHQLPIPVGDMQHTFANIKKAKDLLGYEPQIDFRTGVSKEIEWIKELKSMSIY